MFLYEYIVIKDIQAKDYEFYSCFLIYQRLSHDSQYPQIPGKIFRFGYVFVVIFSDSKHLGHIIFSPSYNNNFPNIREDNNCVLVLCSLQELDNNHDIEYLLYLPSLEVIFFY
jgi:hypothetical protein